MSQEKVERYKKEKANRKKDLKKQKRKVWISRIVGVIFALALTAFIGWSVYVTFIRENPSASNGETVSFSEEELSSLLASAETTTTKNALLNETLAAEETSEGDTTTASASNDDSTTEATTPEPEGDTTTNAQ